MQVKRNQDFDRKIFEYEKDIKHLKQEINQK